MLKLKKEKILVSLIAIVMIALVVGNVYSLATDDNTSGAGTLTLTDTGNKANTANTSNTQNASNTEATVGATNTSNTNKTNNTSNTNTNTNTNSAKNNANSASSKLPYAGSNTSIVFIVVALVASAIYAYKKVSDYNV